MKAKDLKELITQIPDEEEVYYSEYDKYSEEWEANDEFYVKKYRNSSGQIVFVLWGDKPYEFKEEDEFIKEKKMGTNCFLYSAAKKLETWRETLGKLQSLLGI